MATSYESGIDCIVVNYKTPEDLEGFLASYEPGVEATLWVVNVEPDEISRLLAIEYATFMEGVEYIEHAENVGYARAVNNAAAQGHAEIIGIFNADVWLPPDSLDECYFALLDSDAAILGPRQVDDLGKITHAGIFGTNEEPRHRGWQHTDSIDYHDVREAVTVSGAAFFIKRAVWDELTACKLYRDATGAPEGAFLPTSHYYDETWCCYHTRAHGYECVYYGETFMVHKWHRASPVGGWAEKQLPLSQALFREACLAHGIACD